MDLLIHFGIYKTGSSFLQYVCARNRSHLKVHHIYFPIGDREKDMISGNISPGNGGKLPIFLKSGKLEEVAHLLNQWISRAKAADCTRILISSEAIVHTLATENGLKILTEASKKANVRQIRAFGFFRDPVEHCLSTYKHRAKRGSIPDFRHWVAHIYETPTLMANFLQIQPSFPIDWTIRKYKKDASFMTVTFFKDWLGISCPSDVDHRNVNPSLTLSELLVLQEFGKKDRRLVKYLYRKLLNLSINLKANDQKLSQLYSTIINWELYKHREVITAFNKIMSSDEQLINFNFSEEPESTLLEVNLNTQQLGAIAVAVATAANPWRTVLDLIKSVVRSILSTKVRQKILRPFKTSI